MPAGFQICIEIHPVAAQRRQPISMPKKSRQAIQLMRRIKPIKQALIDIFGRLCAIRSRTRARTSSAGFMIGFVIELVAGMRNREGTLAATPKALKRFNAYECALSVTRLWRFEKDERVANPD